MPRSRKQTYEPPIYTFRVRIVGGFMCPPDWPETWRDIEIAGSQTLADLGSFIPETFQFDDPHLWAFFLSKKPWDTSTEYTIDTGPSPFDTLDEAFGITQEKPKDAARTLIRDVPYPGKTGKKEFLYLFDFGDEWLFGVKLRGTSETVESEARYPRVVSSHGESPPQYPELEDEEWEDNWGDASELTEDDLEIILGNMLEQFGVSPILPDPLMLGAAWRTLVEAERAQVERLRETRAEDYYAPVAHHFAADPHRTDDPLLDHLRAMSHSDTTWLDIGAGGGRYALPLALASREVIAVEPSDAMLQVLRDGIARHDIDNIEIRQLAWPEGSDQIQADFSLAAHVGYDISNINEFLDGMERATRERCCIIMMDRAPSHGFVELWKQIHGEPRIQLPALRELIHLLLARGVVAEVRLAPWQQRPMDERDIRENVRRRLWLREGSDKDRQLQALLDDVFARGDEESFALPATIALVTWEPVIDRGEPV